MSSSLAGQQKKKKEEKEKGECKPVVSFGAVYDMEEKGDGGQPQEGKPIDDDSGEPSPEYKLTRKMSWQEMSMSARGGTEHTFSLEELRQLKKIFDEYPEGLNLEEFVEVVGPQVRLHNPGVTDEDLKVLFKRIDANASDSVDWDEISMYLLTNEEKETRQHTTVARANEFAPDPFLPKIGKAVSHNMRHIFHQSPATHLLIHPRLPKYFTASRDGMVKFWSSDCLHHERTPHRGFTPVMDMVLSHWDDSVCVGSMDGSVCFYGADTGELFRSYLGQRQRTILNAKGQRIPDDRRQYVRRHKFTLPMNTKEADKVRYSNSSDVAGIGAVETSVPVLRHFEKDELSEATVLENMGYIRKSGSSALGYGGESAWQSLGYLTAVETANLGGKDRLLVGLQSGHMQMYDLSSSVFGNPISTPNLETMHVHWDSITKIRALPRMDLLLTASNDATVQVRHLERIEDVGTTLGEGYVPAPSDYFHLRSEGFLSMLDTGIRGHYRRILAMDWDEPRRLIATCAAEREPLLWSPYMERPLAKLECLGKGPILDVQFHSKAGQLLTLSTDSVIRLWDLRTYQCVQTIADTKNKRDSYLDDIQRIAYDRRRETVVAVTHKLKAWPALHNTEFPAGYTGHRRPIVSCALSKEYFQFITADSKLIIVWDLPEMTPSMRWDVEEGIVDICMDKNERRLLVGTATGHIHVYNYVNGFLLTSCQPGPLTPRVDTMPLLPDDPARLAFSPSQQQRSQTSSVLPVVGNSNGRTTGGGASNADTASMMDATTTSDSHQPREGEGANNGIPVLPQTKAEALEINSVAFGVQLRPREATVMVSTKEGGSASIYLDDEGGEEAPQRVVHTYGRSIYCSVVMPPSHLVLGTSQGVSSYSLEEVGDRASPFTPIPPAVAQKMLTRNLSFLPGSLRAPPVCSTLSKPTTTEADDEEILGKQRSDVEKITECLIGLSESGVAVSGCGMGAIHFWDVSTQSEFYCFQCSFRSGDAVLTLASDPEESMLFAGDYTGYVSIFDITSVTTTAAMYRAESDVCRPPGSPVQFSAFSFFARPAGRTSSDPLSQLGHPMSSVCASTLSKKTTAGTVAPFAPSFDIPLLHRFRAHQLSVTKLLYLPLQEFLLSGGQDCRVHMWSTWGTHITTVGDPTAASLEGPATRVTEEEEGEGDDDSSSSPDEEEGDGGSMGGKKNKKGPKRNKWRRLPHAACAIIAYDQLRADAILYWLRQITVERKKCYNSLCGSPSSGASFSGVTSESATRQQYHQQHLEQLFDAAGCSSSAPSTSASFQRDSSSLLAPAPPPSSNAPSAPITQQQQRLAESASWEELRKEFAPEIPSPSEKVDDLDGSWTPEVGDLEPMDFSLPPLPHPEFSLELCDDESTEALLRRVVALMLNSSHISRDPLLAREGDRYFLAVEGQRFDRHWRQASRLSPAAGASSTVAASTRKKVVGGSSVAVSSAPVPPIPAMMTLEPSAEFDRKIQRIAAERQTLPPDEEAEAEAEVISRGSPRGRQQMPSPSKPPPLGFGSTKQEEESPTASSKEQQAPPPALSSFPSIGPTKPSAEKHVQRVAFATPPTAEEQQPSTGPLSVRSQPSALGTTAGTRSSKRGATTAEDGDSPTELETSLYGSICATEYSQREQVTRSPRYCTTLARGTITKEPTTSKKEPPIVQLRKPLEADDEVEDGRGSPTLEHQHPPLGMGRVNITGEPVTFMDEQTAALAQAEKQREESPKVRRSSSLVRHIKAAIWASQGKQADENGMTGFREAQAVWKFLTEPGSSREGTLFTPQRSMTGGTGTLTSPTTAVTLGSTAVSLYSAGGAETWIPPSPRSPFADKTEADDGVERRPPVGEEGGGKETALSSATMEDVTDGDDGQRRNQPPQVGGGDGDNVPSPTGVVPDEEQQRRQGDADEDIAEESYVRSNIDSLLRRQRQVEEEQALAKTARSSTTPTVCRPKVDPELVVELAYQEALEQRQAQQKENMERRLKKVVVGAGGTPLPVSPSSSSSSASRREEKETGGATGTQEETTFVWDCDELLLKRAKRTTYSLIRDRDEPPTRELSVSSRSFLGSMTPSRPLRPSESLGVPMSSGGLMTSAGGLPKSPRESEVAFSFRNGRPSTAPEQQMDVLVPVPPVPESPPAMVSSAPADPLALLESHLVPHLQRRGGPKEQTAKGETEKEIPHHTPQQQRPEIKKGSAHERLQWVSRAHSKVLIKDIKSVTKEDVDRINAFFEVPTLVMSRDRSDESRPMEGVGWNRSAIPKGDADHSGGKDKGLHSHKATTARGKAGLHAAQAYQDTIRAHEPATARERRTSQELSRQASLLKFPPRPPNN